MENLLSFIDVLARLTVISITFDQWVD